MKIVRTSAVAALTLAGGMFGGNVAVAGQQQEPSSEPAVVADELLTRAVHAERGYRERLARLQRLRDRADEKGETDRVAEFDALSERSRVEHARKVKRMRGRMSREMLERFDAETAHDHPGRGRALGHQIAAKAARDGKGDVALQRELAGDFWQALAKRHAVQYRQARIDNYLEQWKQRAPERREQRREARRERRKDRREARHDRRQDRREARGDRRQEHREVRKQHSQDRREARHDWRQDRRETKQDHRRNHRETKKDHRQGHREAKKDYRQDRREAKRDHRQDRRKAKRHHREGRRDAKRGSREDRRDRAGNRAEKRSDRTQRRRGKPQLRRNDTPRTPTRRRPDEE